MSKRGRTISSQSREFILKLHQYFERESLNGGPLLPVSRVQSRVAEALGIGKKTVFNIIKEKYGPDGMEDNVLHTPKRRKKRKPVTGIDTFKRRCHLKLCLCLLHKNQISFTCADRSILTTGIYLYMLLQVVQDIGVRDVFANFVEEKFLGKYNTFV